MKSNCNEDCFNCIHQDCIWNGVASSLEAKALDDCAKAVLQEIDSRCPSSRKTARRIRDHIRYMEQAGHRKEWMRVQLAISRDIKAARAKRGWNQVEAAKIIAVKHYLYSAWERGVTPIPEQIITGIYPELKGAEAWHKRDMEAEAAGLGEELRLISKRNMEI